MHLSPPRFPLVPGPPPLSCAMSGGPHPASAAPAGGWQAAMAGAMSPEVVSASMTSVTATVPVGRRIEVAQGILQSVRKSADDDDPADRAFFEADHSERAAAAGRGLWDLTWSKRYRALPLMILRLKVHFAADPDVRRAALDAVQNAADSAESLFPVWVPGAPGV